jgi:hypothetical protein
LRAKRVVVPKGWWGMVNSSLRALRVAGDEYEKWIKNENNYIYVEDLFQY